MNDSFYTSEKAGLAWGKGEGGMQLYHPKFGDFCLSVPFRTEVEIEKFGDAASVGYAEAVDFALNHIDNHNKKLAEVEEARQGGPVSDEADIDEELARLEKDLPPDMAKALTSTAS